MIRTLFYTTCAAQRNETKRGRHVRLAERTKSRVTTGARVRVHRERFFVFVKRTRAAPIRFSACVCVCMCVITRLLRFGYTLSSRSFMHSRRRVVSDAFHTAFTRCVCAVVQLRVRLRQKKRNRAARTRALAASILCVSLSLTIPYKPLYLSLSLHSAKPVSISLSIAFLLNFAAKSRSFRAPVRISLVRRSPACLIRGVVRLERCGAHCSQPEKHISMYLPAMLRARHQACLL